MWESFLVHLGCSELSFGLPDHHGRRCMHQQGPEEVSQELEDKLVTGH